MFKLLLAGLAAVLVFACTDKETRVIEVANGTNGGQNAQLAQGIDVVSATTEQCPAGGIVYSVYLDENANGAKDETEKVLSTHPLCNGANGSVGADGASGSNGSNGQNGQDGQNGSNGHSVVFHVVSAPANVCAGGGSTLLMALDTADTGTYSALLPNQQSMTICHGTNGTDGANGADGQNGQNGQDGVSPAYSPVEPILACGNNVAYKEVLLRLQNGQVLGSFSQDTGGTMTRLAFLPDGTYMNTDTSGCVFSLSTNGSTRSISWDNQVQQSWELTP